MSHTSNIEEEETFAPIHANQEDFNPSDTVSSFLSNTAYDPSRLHPLAGLGGGLDYLNLDDDASTHGTSSGILPSRGWSDDLTYGTGLTYITGTNYLSLPTTRHYQATKVLTKETFICVYTR